MKVFGLSYALIFFGSVFIAASALADILFIDANASYKEIEAAQRAAVARHEKLIVYPDVSLSARRAISDAKNEYSRLETKCLSSCSEETHQKLDEAVKKYEALVKASPNISSAGGLNQFLKDQKDRGVSLSSVVVSGHDGNGTFGGTYGSIDSKILAEAFTKNAPVGDSIRSVLLLGCYTTTAGEVEFKWKKIFPKALLVAGYDDRAPLADRAANLQYIEDVLAKEKNLTEAANEAELKKAFDGLAGVSQVHASMCVGENYVNKKGVTHTKKIFEACKNDENNIGDKYDCYLYGNEGCENVPENTTSGELRQYYRYLQNTAHCNEFRNYGISRPPPEQVLRVLFDKQVRQNFQNLHQEQLDEYDQLLSKQGAPENLRLSKAGDLSRGEFIRRVTQAREFVSQKKNEKGYHSQFSGLIVEDEDLLILGSRTSQLSYYAAADPETIPFAWVEPRAQSPSPYFSKKYLDVLDQRNRGNAVISHYSILDDQALTEHTQSDPDYKRLLERYTELGKQVNRPMRTQNGMGMGGAPTDRVSEEVRRDYSKVAGEFYKALDTANLRIAKERVQFYEQELSRLNSESPSDSIKYKISIVSQNLRGWREREAKSKPKTTNGSVTTGSNDE